MGLKELRKKEGLTQAEAAELFHLKFRTYQNYENRSTTPDMDTCAEMARHFHCTIGALFNLDDRSGIISEGNLSKDQEELLRLFALLDKRGQAILLELALTMDESRRYRSR